MQSKNGPDYLLSLIDTRTKPLRDPSCPADGIPFTISALEETCSVEITFACITEFISNRLHTVAGFQVSVNLLVNCDVTSLSASGNSFRPA